MRRTLLGLAATTAMIAGTVTLAPSANASTAVPAGAYGCSGDKIDTYAVKASNGTLFGNIYLYYDSSSGMNCAVTVATAAGGYGVSTLKGVNLALCDEGSTEGGVCPTQKIVSDDHNYFDYAGPVKLAAAGRCIGVYGYTYSASGVFGENANPSTATHCK